MPTIPYSSWPLGVASCTDAPLQPGVGNGTQNWKYKSYQQKPTRFFVGANDLHIFPYFFFQRFGECQLGCLSGDFEIMDHKLGGSDWKKKNPQDAVILVTGKNNSRLLRFASKVLRKKNIPNGGFDGDESHGIESVKKMHQQKTKSKERR